MPETLNGSLLTQEHRDVIKTAREKIALLDKLLEKSDRTKPEIKKAIDDVRATKERLDILEKL